MPRTGLVPVSVEAVQGMQVLQLQFVGAIRDLALALAVLIKRSTALEVDRPSCMRALSQALPAEGEQVPPVDRVIRRGIPRGARDLFPRYRRSNAEIDYER